ncbi:hypothetical protein M9H77_19789 [Catharanthus roseus]|uniref:Uncharacterized protein n=1 Tax=Catharanthus roseus TaxID=4058 RepID=A0ACC0BBD0_CATRO|nr:hypothetical protein M9H77_19789 [Catharanthus roseus]
MGRKIEMKKIEDNAKCQVTFAKRRNSLLKKAEEIKVSCDVDVALVAFSPAGRISQFSNKERMEDFLLRYTSLPAEKRLGNFEVDPDQSSLQQISWAENNVLQAIETIKLGQKEKLARENEGGNNFHPGGSISPVLPQQLQMDTPNIISEEKLKEILDKGKAKVAGDGYITTENNYHILEASGRNRMGISIQEPNETFNRQTFVPPPQINAEQYFAQQYPPLNYDHDFQLWEQAQLNASFESFYMGESSNSSIVQANNNFGHGNLYAIPEYDENGNNGFNSKDDNMFPPPSSGV